MSKKNISKKSLWILIFSILSLVTVAMVWSPRKELKIRGNADNLLERYDTSDIIEYSGCYINQSGQICINGVDPHIVFKKENIKNVTTIVIKLKDKVSGDLDVQLYFDDGNEFNENDFTCTGMTYDTKNNSIWIADYGAENDNNELNPRLLELDYEYKNVINIINLKNIMDNSFNLQGISYDEIDNSLWLATGDYIYEINKNGDIIQKYSMGKYSKYKSNGIFVDNDKIWILCYKKYLLCLNREGDFINKYKFNFMDQDHIYIYNNKIYCTVGADYSGDNNFVFTFDLTTKVINNLYKIEGSYAIEGIIIKDNIMYIANDGKFHNDIIGHSYISEYKLE